MEEHKLDLKGVEFDLGYPVTHFVTPNWTQVFEGYPEWRLRALEAGMGEAYCGPQSFIEMVCEELERLQARPGRTREDWLTRLLHHFGSGWVARQIREM